MNFPCFVVGSLVPSLNLACPVAQRVNQRQAQKRKVASPGSVAFNFERTGVVRVFAENVEDADELIIAVFDGDATECDLDPDDPEQHRIPAPMEGLQTTRNAVRHVGCTLESAELEMIPNATTDVSDRDFDKNFVAVEMLEDLDDVDAVAANMSRAE